MFTAVNKVQSIIGYHFKNPLLLWKAMQGPGTAVDPSAVKGAGVIHGYSLFKIESPNKRLAVIGDSVLKTALLEHWYHMGYSRGRCM